MEYSDMNNRCNLCSLGQLATKQCMPKGTDNPHIYIIGEAPGPDEDIAGIPFVGRAGKYLHNMLDIFGLNENNCRFFNVCRCFPKVVTEDKTSFRAPNEEEIKICMKYLECDIKRTNPKVILLLGSTATRAILPDVHKGITQIRGNIYKYNDIVTIPTFHPSYLMRNANNIDLRTKFKKDIELAVSICINGLNIDCVSNDLEDNKSKTSMCLNYREFNDFCTQYIDNSSTVGYDVETNAQEVHSEDHEVVGFSIASSKDIGCYVPIKALDFQLNPTDKRLIEKRLKDNILTKNTIVYNCQHEYPATYNWLDFELPNIDDIFVMVKLMMGNADKYQGNGGLKAQSVEYLKYNDWSEDLDSYFTYLLNYSTSKEDMRDLVSKYYEEDEIDDLIAKIEDVVYNVLPNHPKGKTISYEYVPYKLIGRYGSIDSSVLFELKDFYTKWMDEESEKLGIDLHRGYRYWMMHHYAGYILEKNGAYWNDKRAQVIEDWCSDGMHESLKNLIKSPLSESYVRSKLYSKFLVYVRDNHIGEVFGNDYTPVSMLKSAIKVKCNNPNAEMMLKRMSLQSAKSKSGEDTGIYKLEMGNFETLAKDFLARNPDMFSNWYRNYMDNYLKESHTTNEYKVLMNPNATSEEYKKFISNLLITDNIRYAKLYAELVKITEEPGYDVDLFKDFYNGDILDNSPKFSYGFNIEEFKTNNPNYTYKDTDDSRILSLVHKLANNEEISKSDKFDMFMKFISIDRDIRHRKIKKAYNIAVNYELVSLDADTMNEIYELYLMCHIDVEDDKTWNDRFEWLVNYKKFKKFSKLITTYINGKVGRNNVYYVSNNYREGEYFTRRGELFDKDTRDGKCMMMQADFRVCMAETGRWQAGIHNLPAGEAIKGIYTSRFKGGCIAMPDGSQMEVRTLAAECGDENLFKAFKDGLDIHKFFASRIYSVPYDEVQSWQRGLAKNAVFGMIYGESEKAFADIYLNGDLSQAQKVFSDMFTGFPKIKNYIERAHGQYEKYGKVTTVTQRYLTLNDPRIDHNTMLRRSQNYPIQAAAEDIAGIIMYKLIEYMRENNMKSKPFCFIHDSIEIDMHPDEVFQLVDKIRYLFNVFPMEEWGVPVACDVPIGPSMGQECEVEELEHDDQYNDVTITLKGYISDIEEVVESWKEVYDFIEISDKYSDEDKDEYIPWSKIYLPKKAQISMYAGKYRKKGKREIHVIRHK